MTILQKILTLVHVGPDTRSTQIRTEAFGKNEVGNHVTYIQKQSFKQPIRCLILFSVQTRGLPIIKCYETTQYPIFSALSGISLLSSCTTLEKQPDVDKNNCQRSSSHSAPHILKIYFDKIDSQYSQVLSGSLVICPSSGVYSPIDWPPP